MDKELYQEVAEFIRAHRSLFSSVEGWLNTADWFNENSEKEFWFQAWEEGAASDEWEKILFLTWILTDEQLGNCQISVEGFNAAEWVKSNQVWASSDILGGRNAAISYQNERLIRKALAEAQKAAKSEPVKQQKKRTCTLEIFMTVNCEIPQGSNCGYFESKRNLIHSCHRDKKIKLPKLVKKWKSGQAKIFYEIDLIQKWEEYCLAIPTLPPLKNI